MIYVFLGPPASGKDTQIEFLKQYVDLPEISSGDLLRHEIEYDGPFSDEVQQYVEAGAWVPDHLVFKIIEERCQQEDCKDGFILNGFPRTEGQIPMFDKLMAERKGEIIKVIHFDLDEDEAMRRMKTQEEEDPRRMDESIEAQRNRFQEYAKKTLPILEEFEKRGNLIRIDASPSREEIFKKVLEALDIPEHKKKKL